MLRTSCFVTGDDFSMLQHETPDSKKKVKALASISLLPVLIWLLIGYNMVTNIMKGPWYTALLVGIMSAFVIFLIEKNIIMAPKSKGIMRLRIILGAVIAMLGAVFVDEAVFREDINQQLVIMRNESLESSAIRVDAKYREEIALRQHDIDKRYQDWQNALLEANREADGSGGSGMRGVQAITLLKLNVASKAQGEYEKSRRELAGFMTSIEREKLDQEGRINNAFSESALLQRIKALFHLVFSDWAMAGFYLLFTALLFIMEFLVVFLKNSWPTTNYERKCTLMEEVGKRRMARILESDHQHFEPGKSFRAHIDAQEQLIRTAKTGIYN